ncbi:prefoldin, alpha subunit [Necator americanus]|uniref:Prefoldin, alpha subunit n=1 Tax=Necator americanus TaxID=51031 RepID=W2TBB3_NECAM|nr:prefoldin, alpha subunit [Necator americanus]ETN78884.1 prefoldin, alpha subunit [Necator americanus]
MASSAILNEERMKTYSTATKETLARIGKLLEAKQKELIEYESLIRKLEELPRKRTHSIMCPIGSVGFLPATIVHSNEVLVGLGDGYFVDTTCYDAAEILQRRKKIVEKNIADLHEHENLVKNYSKYARELFERQRNSDEVEIREEYDEAKEDALRRKRKSRFVAPKSVTKTVADINAEAEMMKRLEELEQQELRNGELDHSFDKVIEAEEDEPPPTLDKILEKLDDEDTKCLMSILSSDSAVSSTEKQEQFPSEKPCATTQRRASEQILPDPTTKTATEAPTERKKELSSKLQSSSVSEAVKEDDLKGYFRGDDLVRMLAEQEEEYDENSQTYQPPPGISTEVVEPFMAYQRILRVVEEMNDDASGDDDDDEDGGILEEDEEDSDTNNVDSELDSDDLSEPEQRVQFGPFTVQNLGPNAPVINSSPQNHLVGNTARNVLLTTSEGTATRDSGPRSDDDREGVRTSAEESKRKSPKKKKSVVFAEKLENSTLIDKNAPPSDVRVEPSTSSSNTTIASILRNADEKTPTNARLLTEMTIDEEPRKVILPGSRDAFTGVIRERNTKVLEAGDVVPSDNGEPTKRRSLFKMKRLKNHV